MRRRGETIRASSNDCDLVRKLGCQFACFEFMGVQCIKLRGGWRRLRRADEDILVASRHSEVRLDLETLGISLLTVHPRDECRRIICARDVREGIPAAD